MGCFNGTAQEYTVDVDVEYHTSMVLSQFAVYLKYGNIGTCFSPARMSTKLSYHGPSIKFLSL